VVFEGEERRGEEFVFLAHRPFFLFGCGLRRSGGWVILIEVLTCLVAVVECMSVWLSGCLVEGESEKASGSRGLRWGIRVS
jgi:hypothetical protein